MKYSIAQPWLVSLMAAGCLVTGTACTDSSNAAQTPAGELPRWDMLESDLERELEPDISDDARAAMGRDQRAFAIDLYHTLRTEETLDKSFSISAHSITTAFGMLYAGTVGTSREQMEQTLRFSVQDEALHQAHNWVDLELRSRNLEAIDNPDDPRDPVIYEPANGVWFRNDLADSVLPDYLDLLARHYGAGVHLADFSNNHEGERQAINRWVEVKTHGLIPELFKPATIPRDAAAVLVNAFYLKAPWATPFEADLTQREDFTRLDGSTVEVEMMRDQAFDARLSVGDDHSALAMPLRGGAFELVLIVPSDDFAAFEDDLDVDRLETVLAGLEQGLVDVAVPRFQLSTDLLLRAPLTRMGLEQPFLTGADFSGISSLELPPIFRVVHSTVLKVDEKGTEASAATGIVLGEGGEPEPDPGAVFRADRPFLLLLQDRATQTPLLLGRVLDPTSP